MITNTQSTNSTYLTTYTKYRIYNKGNANLRGDITHEKALHVEKNAHYEPIHAVDVTKDGKYIATCSSDKTIIIWETRRMRKLHTFYGHMADMTLCPTQCHVHRTSKSYTSVHTHVFA